MVFSPCAAPHPDCNNQNDCLSTGKGGGDGTGTTATEERLNSAVLNGFNHFEIDQKGRAGYKREENAGFLGQMLS